MDILLIFGVLMVVVIIAVVQKRKRREEKEERHEEPEALEEFLQKQQKKKEDGKAKILEHLKDHARITNDDVEKILDVSDSTATRYLQELEQEKEIMQIGKTGRSVHYIRR